MRLFLFAFFMLAIGACVEPFKLDAGQSPISLVISGSITDLPGPYTIELYNSQAIDRSKVPTRVSEASVTISDNEGVVEHLTETEPGVYKTNSIQGVIGNSYTLKVILTDGSVYTSTAETMLPVGQPSNFRAEFIQNVSGVLADQARLQNGFNLYVDAAFDPAQENRAVWFWSGVFKFTTHPENHYYVIGTKITVPDPLPCSGYIADYKGNLLQQKPCVCCVCFHTNYNTSPEISDQRKISNGVVHDQYVGFVPADDFYFEDKYFIILQQTSASQEVYDFWSRVAKAAQLGSDLFQTPPAKTRGNISADGAASFPVIGLFSAHAVKTDSLILTANDVPYSLALNPSLVSCLDFYRKDNTTVRPPFYIVLP